MMSLVIRGMEMPKSCYNCWALDDYCDYPRCRITEEQRGYTFPIREKRMDKCPLAPIPPHGRLIDADVLRENWLENGENEYVYDTNAFLDSLDDSPTVIPAEEGE